MKIYQTSYSTVICESKYIPREKKENKMKKIFGKKQKPKKIKRGTYKRLVKM